MNRDRAEVYLRLLAEEELRLAVARCPDGPAESWPVDDAVRPVSVAGALAGRAARRGGGMAPGRGWSADRAVAGLYLAQYQALMRQAGMMVRDTRVAEEVVQGSFVAVHGGWPRLGDARAAEDYLRQEVANRSRAVLRHGTGRGGGPQQLRQGGSGEHLARAARVAQLMTAVNGRVGQHVSSHLRVARAARALTTVGALDDGVAGQILADLELALAARRAVSGVLIEYLLWLGSLVLALNEYRSFITGILAALAPGGVEVGAWVLAGQPGAELLLRGLHGVFLDAPPEPA
jgi:hypothetical protein